MKLVKDKGVLHKTTTVILSVLLVVVSVLEIVQPYLLTLSSVIPDGVFPWVSAAFGVAIGVGRYIHQDLKDGKIDGVLGEEDASDS